MNCGQSLMNCGQSLLLPRSEFNAFRKEMPGLIADTMREVLREFRSR
jgi:hypothetical protein